MALIDKDQVKAEIERMREINKKAFMAEHIREDVFHGRTQAINHLSAFLDTLPEQPEPKPMNIPSAGGGMSTTPPKFKLDVKPEQLIGWDDENAADKKAVKEIVKTVHKEITRQVKEMLGRQPVTDCHNLEEELENYAKLYPFEDAGSYRNLITLARHFAEWERKRTLDKVVEWMKKNLTYTHPRKGVETCMVNIGVFLDAMGMGAENLKK